MFFRHERDPPERGSHLSLLDIPLMPQEHEGVVLSVIGGPKVSIPLRKTIDLPMELMDAGIEVRLLIGYKLVLQIYSHKTDVTKNIYFDEVCSQSNPTAVKINRLFGHMLHQLLRIAFHWERAKEYKRVLKCAADKL